MDKNFHFGYTLQDYLILRNNLLKESKVNYLPKQKVKTIGSKGKKVVIRRTK